LKLFCETSCNPINKLLHEAYPSKAVDIFDDIMKQGEINLARQRKVCALSQSQLAKAANVSVRSVQLYEQRQTDINNAQHNHLKALSKVLGCSIDDISE